ncbi:hypothetical protein [Halomontanus rarus]|uniref:hypothetical protein n=1 Tax=Halomontanus rarus TaxID=3034020 RepID=UPI0023E89501|nr:hypothetical protein [Halovivax sp. TS33]
MTSGRKSRRQRSARKSNGGGIQSLERWTFRTVAKVLFVFVFGAFIFIGLASDLLFVAALAGIAIFLWGAVIFPTKEFKGLGRYLASGEAGDDAHGLWCKLIPWRGK